MTSDDISSQEGNLPGLLRIPLEIRWQIFRYVLVIDKTHICSHNRLSFIVLSLSRIGSITARESKPDISALFVNHQLYHEMTTLLYKENFFYFEHCLTYSAAILPTFLTSPSTGPLVQRIGFSVNQQLSESFAPLHVVLEEMDRIKTVCLHLKRSLPNLKETRFYLFCYPKLQQRFLQRLIDSIEILPAKRIIIIQGSNREKQRITAMVRGFINSTPPSSSLASNLLVLGGCICSPFTNPPGNLFSSPQTRPEADTLYAWVSRRWKWVEAVKRVGSLPVGPPTYKGPLVGCLLCGDQEGCLHECSAFDRETKRNMKIR